MEIFRVIKTILNLSIAASGVLTVVRLLYTYDNPIFVGALFIILICIKCTIEVLDDLL